MRITMVRGSGDGTTGTTNVGIAGRMAVVSLGVYPSSRNPRIYPAGGGRGLAAAAELATTTTCAFTFAEGSIQAGSVGS